MEESFSPTRESKEKYKKLYAPFFDIQGKVSLDKISESPKNFTSAIEIIPDPNNSNRASFRFLTEDAEMMNAAVLSYDTLLTPMAEIKGEEFNRKGNHGGLVMKEPGSLIRQGDHWVVEKKAKVRTVYDNDGHVISDNQISREEVSKNDLKKEPIKNDANQNISKEELIEKFSDKIVEAVYEKIEQQDKKDKEREREYEELEASYNHTDPSLEQKVRESENKVIEEIRLWEQHDEDGYIPKKTEKQKLLFSELMELKKSNAPKDIIEAKQKEWEAVSKEILEKSDNKHSTEATHPHPEESTEQPKTTGLQQEVDVQMNPSHENTSDTISPAPQGKDSLEEDTNVSKKYAIDRATSSEDLARYRKELEDELETIQEDNHPRLTEIDGLIEQIKVYENAYNLGLSKDARDKVILEYENPEDPFVRKSKTNKKRRDIMDLAKQIQEEEKSDTDHITGGLKKQLDDKKVELESKQTQPKRDKEMKNILEQRRFGHTKQLFEGFAKSNEKNKKHYEKLQQIFSKKYEELSESEQKLVRSINFKDFINEKKVGKEGFEKITLKKEALEILGKRVRSLEDNIMKQEGKNLLQRGWKRFSAWYENPDNKRKLHKRALISAGVTAALAATGVGALGLVGANALRFAGSYAGGETARWLYDRNKKDYRQRMADFRREFEKNPGHLAEKKNIKESVYQNYKKRRDELMASSAGYIQNKNKWRERWDTIGRILGGVSVRGAEELFSEADIIPEDTKNIEDIHPTPIPENVDPVPVPPENNEIMGISKDAYINKGEGITHALLRQLQANPELRSAFGIEGNATGADAARVAREFGYINDDGSEVRVFMGEGAAYELKLDENGNPIVREHKGGTINGDFYEGGEKVERHMKGTQFEGQNIEKQYEYIHGENTTPSNLNYENNSHSDISESITKIEDNFNTHDKGLLNSSFISSENFTDRTYPGHIFLQPGTFDSSFNNILGDKAVRELFEQHGVAFTQENMEKFGFRYDENAPHGKHFINIYDDEKTHYGWKDIYERFDIENAKNIYFDEEITQIPINSEGILEVMPQENEQGFEVRRKNIVGPFEVLYDTEGLVRPQINESFVFKGEINTEPFSDRDIKLIEKGKMTLEMSIDDEKFGPYNHTRIIQLKNGQYALEMIGGAQNLTDAQTLAEQKAFNILDTFGMEGNTSKHFVTQALEGTDGYMAKVYVPISESQAKFIGSTYTDLGMVLGQN